MLLANGREVKNPTQWAKNFTEPWWARHGYCFDCESAKPPTLTRANTRATDYICENCGHPYELKSTRSASHAVIADGAYTSMMGTIAANETPSFLLMRYSTSEKVLTVATVHRTFITAQAIQPRKPLSPMAKRAGWVGCNIRMNTIPADAKIAVLEDERFLDRDRVREQVPEAQQNLRSKSRKPELDSRRADGCTQIRYANVHAERCLSL